MDTVQNLIPRKPSETTSHSELHRQILDTTVQLFVEAGYSNVTTNLIAQRAGVSVGSIYRFYPNKFAIFNALVEKQFREMDEAVDGYIASADSATPWEGHVDGLAARLATVYSRNRGLVMTWGVLSGNPETEKADNAYAAKSSARIASYLAQIAPDSAPSDFAAASRAIYWTTLNTLDESVRPPDRFDDERLGAGKAMLKAYIRQLTT